MSIQNFMLNNLQCISFAFAFLGTITDGEFSTLGTKGSTREVHLYEIGKWLERISWPVRIRELHGIHGHDGWTYHGQRSSLNSLCLIGVCVALGMMISCYINIYLIIMFVQNSLVFT